VAIPGRTNSSETTIISTMAGSSNNQRIIPLDEGWNDEIKAKVRKGCHCGIGVDYFAVLGARPFARYNLVRGLL
jgi:hypothetical protein